MNQMKRKAAARIAMVTLAMAALASPLAWYVSRENAEEEVVALAQEEARRVLQREQALRLDGAQAREHAELAARQLAGGLFDIAEIYGPDGRKLAETVTEQGEKVEAVLPKHGAPRYAEAFYERLTLETGAQVLRVFVPLREAPPGGPVTGYFEGVRVLPQWQTDQIFSDALVVGLMVCLASLVCGAAMYPVVVHLASENEHKAREVLESHIAMMEALGRAIAKRDSDTGAHNYRVAWVSAILGETLGLQGAAMQSLILGSFLHDAGKIGIPDAILLKPGRLDEDEMRTMRTHVRQGEEIVTGAGWLDGARDVVACHHEKWDGSGYPRARRRGHSAGRAHLRRGRRVRRAQLAPPLQGAPAARRGAAHSAGGAWQPFRPGGSGCVRPDGGAAAPATRRPGRGRRQSPDGDHGAAPFRHPVGLTTG